MGHLSSCFKLIYIVSREKNSHVLWRYGPERGHPATGYSQGVGVLRLYPVAGGLELITGCNQQGRQTQADI